MDILVIIISILLVLITVGTAVGIFIRRTIHKSVDELDERKTSYLTAICRMKLPKKNYVCQVRQNKNLKLGVKTGMKLLSQFSQVLKNNLILRNWLGNIEFERRKNNLSWVENRLITVEQQLDIMVEDIDRLVSAEQKNRAEISSIKEMYQELSSELLKRRGSYGEVIRELINEMQENKEALTSFEESTENGSYLQARKQLIEIKERLTTLNEQMDRIPFLLVQARTTLPGELRNLQIGIKQMEDDGYHLGSFSFDTKIDHFQSELERAGAALKELKVTEANTILETIQQETEQMYETLEDEVSFKNKLQSKLPVLREKVADASDQMQKLLHETTHVQKSYLIAKEETQLQTALQKDLRQSQSQLNVIVDVTENQKQTFSSIYEMAEKWLEQMESLSNGIKESIERLQRLRKEEIKAQEKVNQLREVLLETKRIVYKSNLPGVPVSHLESLDQAEGKLIEAKEALSQLPLEMNQVEELVSEAGTEIEKNAKEITQMVETAKLAEHSIQYSNRFRGQSETVREALNEAEEAFLRYEYDLALDLVQKAVSKYEPDLINKVTRHMSA
ncbi:LOW QUALITY PROTEIN: septation ring formation regulator EzrA [Bacillus sp. JCM 19045]|nr:LOW QUALITY PROTEIN: septation ring formation regulator EzrA [Bacillus sp. JCM 19045]